MKDKVVYQLKDKAIWVVFVILVVAFTVANPRFINPNNLLMMLRQVAILGIASIGMTFVILLGDIDLATGSIITFVNILCAYLMVHMGVNMWLAILITLNDRNPGADCDLCDPDGVPRPGADHVRRSSN